MADDFTRFMQCLTCGQNPADCGCTEADEDENGMCKRRKMTDEEWKKVKESETYIPTELIEFMAAIPDFKDRGVEHTAPCPCGGTIHAIRSTYNGHIHARCDKCGAAIIE